MKNYYELLEVRQDAGPDEIKRGFRRVISRYHPDKVQHLGEEFRTIAAVRAADLTEAYRVLMDAGLRAGYDASLAAGMPARPAPSPAQAPEAAPRAPQAGEAPSDRIRPDTEGHVRRAVVDKFREAVFGTVGDAAELRARGFDVALRHQPRAGLFRRAVQGAQVLARVVPFVDAVAVRESWALARDWTALVPADAPPIVRAILERLKGT